MLMKTHELRGITRDVYEKKGVRCQLLGFRFQVSQVSGFRFQVSAVSCGVPDARCQLRDIKSWSVSFRLNDNLPPGPGLAPMPDA